jgi:GGDEF domain-containing protein
MDENRRLRVFLCHSSNDKPPVRILYKRLLLEQWIDPWLDEVTLKPGQDWQLEIEKAVDQTDVVIVCLSQNSITKEGYIQKEIRKALDKAEEKPDDTIFIIPLRFEECDIPTRLAKWHWEDYFKENWYSRLIESLRLRGEKLRISHMAPDRFEQIAAELQETRRALAVREAELKAVIAQADEVAHTNALTFLPNRRQIIGDLQREVIFSEHYVTPLSISMLDLDNFKEINDTYGHIIGDEVLKDLTTILRQSIRYPGTIGRYGGDEFLLVFPAIDPNLVATRCGCPCFADHQRSMRQLNQWQLG